MAVVHLAVLGVLGELVVSTSDLTHTELPEITKKTLLVNDQKEKSKRQASKGADNIAQSA